MIGIWRGTRPLTRLPDSALFLPSDCVSRPYMLTVRWINFWSIQYSFFLNSCILCRKSHFKMESISPYSPGEYLRRGRSTVKNDENLAEGRRLLFAGATRFPESTFRYLTDKFPIIWWGPKYRPRWIINDFIAGLTIGVLLVRSSLI
jgi:hypothetical protein